jgi:hypothetical protein
MTGRRPRPAYLKALGNLDPPESIEIGGIEFQRVEIFKHDSWAATALYHAFNQKIVCKFNRQQPLGLVPMGWLGRWLAKREAAHYRRLQTIFQIPRLHGSVSANGVPLPYAVAHEYIAGKPLGKNEVLPPEFDRQLQELVDRVHRCQLAYVDLHKRENIIVASDGRPFLIDFQVSWMAPEEKKWWSLPQHWILKKLQAMDRYHLEMHEAHHRRLRGDFSFAPKRPWWIRAHRCISAPLRRVRRWILVKLNIRSGEGRAESEHNPEKAFH